MVMVNDHEASTTILRENGIEYQLADLRDDESGWEERAIKKYDISRWINDRLDTEYQHAKNVKDAGVLLVTFDDRGSGASISDINISALVFKDRGKLRGCKVYTGEEYLILNPQIRKYRRLRESGDRILVTMGGSDTHGVTHRIVDLLFDMGWTPTIHIGPSYEHGDSLERVTRGRNVDIVTNVKDMFALYHDHDLAITGGGVTPFEANATGLPCIIVANELFEVEVGQYLDLKKTSWYLCYHEQLKREMLKSMLELSGDEVKVRSERGLNTIPQKAVENVYRRICEAS